MKALSINKSVSLLLFGGFVLTLLLVELYVVQSPIFTEEANHLSLAITLDVVIGIPILFYFFVIRKFQLKLASILLVYLAAVGVAGWILPNEHEGYLAWFEFSLIFSEAILIGFLGFNIRKIIKQYRIESKLRNDFILNLEASLKEVLGKATGAMVGEIAMLRYAFFFWKIKSEHLPTQYPFTVHKKPGVAAMIGALMMAIAAEAAGVHLLLASWNYTVAIILLVLSIYSFIFLIGYLVAIYKRPTIIENNQLTLRIGFVWYAVVDFDNIEKVEIIKRIDEADKSILNIASATLTSPNILITLKEPITLTWLYGMKKNSAKLAIFMDERDKFVKELTIDNG